MKFYVASRFLNYRAVREMTDHLTRVGHECTHDWTRTDEFDENGDLALRDPYAISNEQKYRYAMADLLGVRAAEFVVVLGAEGMIGAWIEFGIALENQNVERIFMIDPPRGGVFFALPKVTVLDLNTFLAMVEEGL